MLKVMLQETHKLVAIEDVQHIRSIIERFKNSGDLEENAIAMIAEAILESLGL